jgi:miniconductance mechanosensitive channel
MKETQTYQLGDTLERFLLENGFSESLTRYIVDFSNLFIILFVMVIVYYVAKVIINRFLKRLIRKSASKWDDHLYEQRVFTRLAMLLPALVLQASLTATIADHPVALRFIELGLKLYMTSIVLLVIISFLNAVYRIYSDFEVADSKPIKGYIQIVKMVIYVIFGISIVSIIIGQSPITLLAGLGAMSAVLMLIFKDSILGFVAGVQLSSNKMLQIGDWITMPKYNTDGNVLDISLVTVKVRNFDNSVSFIPAYALVSDAFQNWRSMGEAGGRRMKRSLLLDIGTIRFPDERILENLRRLNIPVDKWLEQDKASANLGLFRNYLIGYLRNIPNLNQDASLMVRTLQPTENGLPLEIYAFYIPPTWSEFEDFQAQLFEHIYAILPQFGLKAFQRPSGRDVQISAVLPE